MLMHELTEEIKTDLLKIAGRKDKFIQYRKGLKLPLILCCLSAFWVSPQAKQESEQDSK